MLRELYEKMGVKMLFTDIFFKHYNILYNLKYVNGS